MRFLILFQLFIVFIISTEYSIAQSVNFSIEPYQLTLVKAGDRNAFWSYTNSGGKLNPNHNQMLNGLRFDYRLNLGNWVYAKTYSDVYLSSQFGAVPQDYGIEIGVKKWFISGWGTQNPDVGTMYHPLSTGSFVYSGNAKPFEKIYFATDGLVPLYILGKFKEYFLINGYISHSTFKHRAVYNEMLHHKFLYGHALKPLPFSVYGGLSHMAFWGGETEEYGTLASDWNTFKNLFWAIGGGDIGPSGETSYTIGNHIGIFDYGAILNVSTFKFDLYRTFLVEDRDGLNYKNLWEGAFGGILTLKKHNWIRSIIYEYIYTKRQSGDTPPPEDNSRGGPGGWDNYYNHFLYTDGWTSDGLTIGNPLLFSKASSGLGFRAAVANNRIVAHHLGMESTLPNDIEMKTFITYTRNYGTYHERYWAHENNRYYIFNDGPRQWYLGTWLTKKIMYYSMPVEITLGLFADFGDVFGTQFSSLLKISTRIQQF